MMASDHDDVRPHLQGEHTDVRARVLVCIGRPEASDGLVPALEDAGYEVTAVERLAEAAERVEPGETVVIIVDDHHDGWLRLVSDLVNARSTARPLLLADLDEPEAFLAAVSAGVAGFCRPDASADAIVRSVAAVWESGASIPRDLVTSLVDEVRHGRGHRVRTAVGEIEVTDREWQILQMLLQRRSTREIAESLFVSVGTVRSHVSTLLRKLGAVDREDAISLIERGHRS